MFETSTDGVVELNVRAKKYAVVPPKPYSNVVWNIPKTKISQETWDSCMDILKDQPEMFMYWKNAYEVA